MVARTDLRPTRADDSLKKLLGKVANPQTVPHGVKVAQPGEYVDFHDTAGVAHRWDGDTIAEYDTRITEGAAAVAEAKAHLVEVEADLAEAKERITATNGDLSLYVQRVEAAQAAADTANATLQGLTSELETAQSAVDAVTARTGAVESAVAAADSKAVQANNAATHAANAAQTAQAAADTADAKAVSANSAASTAQTTADKAVSDASTAQAAAKAADAKALAASGVANGKGKVIYSTTAPGTADRLSQNLWVRLPDNAPHRWSGSAWVAVTDKTATDAATAAANAQTAANTAKATADQAVADAAAAASVAQAANIAAGNAQRTADGKTVALFGTATPPPAPGVTQGDLYYRTGTDNRIIEHWQWSGSAWVKRAIESAQLVNFDAGYITAGFLDVSNRIQAGAILADKLTVGIGDNLVPNGNGQALAGWSAFGWDNVGPATNNGYPGSFWIQGQKTRTSDKFPATPGKYRFSVSVKGEADGQRFYVQVLGYNAAGTRINPAPYQVVDQNVPNGAWQTFTGNVTLPGGITQAAIAIYSMHPNGAQDPTKYIWYTGFSLRELKDGSLIVNGSITGEKVNAESVAAAVGSFVKVNAENVGVTGELAARVVSAMTAQVKNLVVTESAILQHSTLLGETVAEQLNVTKTLVARDAIVDGTLDVAQLNVTGDMAAQMVSAMSVESKKLIVTEDAILNRATVVQSLVTPELIAEKIDVQSLGAQLVTSGAIQTDPAANRGVKINNAGVNAWDTSGNQTIRLNGSDNLLMGQLVTGNNTSGRIRVFNAIHPVNQRPAGFITLQDAGGITASQGVIEYNNSTLQLSIKDGTEQGYSQPFRKGIEVTRDGLVLAGNLTLSGLFNQTESFQAQSNGPYTVNASSFIDVIISFPSSGNRPYIIPSVSFDDAVDVNLSLWNVTTTSARIRVYNSSTRAVRGLYVDAIILPLKR